MSRNSRSRSKSPAAPRKNSRSRSRSRSPAAKTSENKYTTEKVPSPLCRCLSGPILTECKRCDGNDWSMDRQLKSLQLEKAIAAENVKYLQQLIHKLEFQIGKACGRKYYPADHTFVYHEIVTWVVPRSFIHSLTHALLPTHCCCVIGIPKFG